MRHAATTTTPHHPTTPGQRWAEECRRAGSRAYHRGAGIDRCPWDRGTPESADWRKGYMAAWDADPLA